VIVGGGAAGLSAALVLGRARRGVVVLDQGAQSNLAARGIGGLLGHDGASPGELYERARGELAGYPSVEVRRAVVSRAWRESEGFVLEGADGQRLEADRVLLATGMAYQMPKLQGVAELWGKDVFHCPYCHGWEVRDRALGVLGSPRGVHRALLLRGWSSDVALLTDGPAELDEVEQAQLERAGVAVIERPVAGLRAEAGRLKAVLFKDGGELAREGLLVRAPLKQRSALASELGAALTDADQIDVDEFGQTTVPGLYAAGDICVEVPQVSTAIAAGAVVAAMINDHLIAQEYGVEPSFPLRAQPAAARF
jgi:thioredoxin reductase